MNFLFALQTFQKLGDEIESEMNESAVNLNDSIADTLYYRTLMLVRQFSNERTERELEKIKRKYAGYNQFHRLKPLKEFVQTLVEEFRINVDREPLPMPDIISIAYDVLSKMKYNQESNVRLLLLSEDIQTASHVNQIVRYLLENEFIKSNNKDTQLITAKGLQVKETILTNRAEVGNEKTRDRSMANPTERSSKIADDNGDETKSGYSWKPYLLPVAKWVWLIITGLVIAFLSKFFGWV